jgi:hypothetical protein
MPKLSIHTGPPVRLAFPGRIGMSMYDTVTALVLRRVRALVHYEIGIFKGETLAYVTVQPLTDYSVDEAQSTLLGIANELAASERAAG